MSGVLVPTDADLERLRSPKTPARMNADKTHCPQGHPYAGDNLMLRANGGRECRECSRECSRAEKRRYRAARRARREVTK